MLCGFLLAVLALSRLNNAQELFLHLSGVPRQKRANRFFPSVAASHVSFEVSAYKRAPLKTKKGLTRALKINYYS
jgi:hypothetical protein